MPHYHFTGKNSPGHRKQLGSKPIALNIFVPDAFDALLMQKAIKSQTNGEPGQPFSRKKTTTNRQYQQEKLAAQMGLAKQSCVYSGSAPYMRR